ncbi:MAG: hypothetical protein US40_C0011G0047 [Candidatus Roizmanbacteria bacterium GW2011_GWC2_37_13]|uniref:Uncharacterized protein n=1 Tax=Candidatus Roizmanbacteria bacterium GW2011_GWC2_37_13 TaxID=1618486 RepID=A0A0G0G558_9BACT|nr:MAG: hypothetical protein US40_C0011G0047 [Candidatus Roizmanbacteria bacterium GW2011_GWC2_37_13]
MVAYRVENFGDPVILTAKLVNFEPKDNLGNIRLKDDFTGPVRFSLDNADLQLDQPFFLKTGDSQQLLLRIRLPEGAPAGDYYYTLLAETTPPNTTEGIGSARSRASIGSNILITVTDSGVVEVKPKIVLFSTIGGLAFVRDLRIYDSFDKIPLVFMVENKGKNMIKPEGQISLKGNFGEETKYDIIPKNILSQSQRLIEATPSSQLVTSHQQPVTLILSGFFIGLYRLSTQVTFGENSPTVFASTSFFAFPFKLIAGLVTVIVITILIIKKFSKNSDEDS